MEPVSFGTAIANSVMLLFGFLSDVRKQKLQKDHFEALQLIEAMKAKRFPYWSTVRLIKARKKLQNFSLAFLQELHQELKEKVKTT